MNTVRKLVAAMAMGATLVSAASVGDAWRAQERATSRLLLFVQRRAQSSPDDRSAPHIKQIHILRKRIPIMVCS